MGRPQLTAKNTEKLSLPDSTISTTEKTDLLCESRKRSLDHTKPQPEINGSANASSQKAKATLTSSRKKVKQYSPYVRRSGRIQGAVLPSRNHRKGHVIEEITLSESEKEDDDEPPAHQETKLPETTLAAKVLDEKTDYLLQLLETHGKTLEALNFKGEGSSSEPNVTYKHLYMESQRKVELLTDENRQLSQKLGNALGKLEAYEKETQYFPQLLEKFKDIIIASNLAKTTKTAVNASAQALTDAAFPVAVPKVRSSMRKRKKLGS